MALSALRAGRDVVRRVLPIDVVRQVKHWRAPHAYDWLRDPKHPECILPFDEHRCVFVHVPKSAGISVKRALFGEGCGGHRSAAEYKEILGPLEYRRRFTFTFVRDPYARLVSAYTFIKRGGLNKWDQAIADKLDGIDTFEAFVLDWLTPETVNVGLHFRPQVHYVCDQGKVAVDFVGRFERISEDFEHIRDRLAVDAQLEHRNKTSRSGDVSAFYTPEVKARVAELYAADFATFGYPT